MDAARETWRQQVREAALDPDVAIVDAHHHIVPEPHRARLETYLLADIVDDIARCGHRIVATVHVDAFSNYRDTGPESLRPVGETEHIAALAYRAEHDAPVHGIFAAIVGHADVTLGRAVGEVLDAQIAASPRLRGVRRMTIADRDLGPGIPGRPAPGLMLTTAFRDGLREVAARKLSFDAGLAHPQLPELVTLARAVPDARIILGHIGTPLGIGRFASHPAAAFAEWRDGMAALATCPNVMVKIGGLNMPFTGLGATIDASMPLTSQAMADRQGDHVHATIDLFGPERCLFESNFPVDKWYTSYCVLWNSFKRMAARYSAAERAALFSVTAARAYGIDLARVTAVVAPAARSAELERPAQ